MILTFYSDMLEAEWGRPMATKYIVHGEDRKSGKDVRKIIEADSATDAERTAQDLGILVTGVEGTPSHWTNASVYVLCAIFFCLIIQHYKDAPLLPLLHKPVEVREIVRDLTEAARRRHRVRELDIGAEPEP